MQAPEQRTIKDILDLKTGEHLDAALLLDNTGGNEVSIFQLRTEIEIQIQQKAVEKVCAFCKQPVAIRGRKREDNTSHFFFVHLHSSNDCEIKSTSRFTEEEIRCIKYNGEKESELHFRLKMLIGHYLSLELGAENVKVDEVYKNEAISKNWRKPDVLAVFKTLTIAFELQLSTTFLSVIVARTLFYKEQSVFLIWIFRHFSVEQDFQKFTQKDVFYNNHINVFVFDQEAERLSEAGKELRLKCFYQDFSIIGDKVVGHWHSLMVSIKDLTYDTVSGIYYKDSERQRQQLLAELRDREAAQKRQRPMSTLERKGVEDCHNYLRVFYADAREREMDFNGFEHLSERAVMELNSRLKFSTSKLDFIASLFFDPNRRSFLQFLCEQDKIDLDLSGLFIDGDRLFEAIIHSDSFLDFNFYVSCIFRRGYVLTKADDDLIQRLYDKNYFNTSESEREAIRRWAVLNMYGRLKTYKNSFLLMRHHDLLISIESLKQNMSIGYKYALKQISHNVLEHKQQYFGVYLRAIKIYNLWDYHIENDRSGKFRAKLANFEASMPVQDRGLDPLIFELFPELDIFDLF